MMSGCIVGEGRERGTKGPSYKLFLPSFAGFAPGSLFFSNAIWPVWCASCSQTWNHLHRLLVGPQASLCRRL